MDNHWQIESAKKWDIKDTCWWQGDHGPHGGQEKNWVPKVIP